MDAKKTKGASADEAPAEKSAKRPPIKVFLIEDVSASVFAREVAIRGELRTFYSVSFSRSYRDANGTRRYVKTFNLEDLGKVVTVAQQASDYIHGLLNPQVE